MADAVVLVSGGAAVTPFTDPDRASGSGLAAGNTLTALRAHLLERGAAVFTAPARIGDGEVGKTPGGRVSMMCRRAAAEMTVNAVGGIDEGGARLAAFLRWLGEEHGFTDVDLVAHSMGGLFSRAAIRHLQGAGPSVHRLLTLGTPWEGSCSAMFSRARSPRTTPPATRGPPRSWRDRAATPPRTRRALPTRSRAGSCASGMRTQVGVLDTIAVTAIGAGHFHTASEPLQLWPHDGLVSQRSARADDVPSEALPRAVRHSFDDDVHSIFFADAFGLPWERALTWDPEVFAVVDDALQD